MLQAKEKLESQGLKKTRLFKQFPIGLSSTKDVAFIDIIGLNDNQRHLLHLGKQTRKLYCEPCLKDQERKRHPVFRCTGIRSPGPFRGLKDDVEKTKRPTAQIRLENPVSPSWEKLATNGTLHCRPQVQESE